MFLEQINDKSDEEIAAMTLENQANLAEIIRRYQDKLTRYVRRISSFSDEDIQDILQEVFIKVYENLHDFDQDLKFNSWIYRIAHNQTVSSYRKLQARPHGHLLEMDETGWNRIAAELNLDLEMDQILLQDQVAAILLRLDGKYREVLVLKFLEEKDYREISDILKKPMGTVASLISRAKQEFARELNQQNKSLEYDRKKSAQPGLG